MLIWKHFQFKFKPNPIIKYLFLGAKIISSSEKILTSKEIGDPFFNKNVKKRSTFLSNSNYKKGMKFTVPNFRVI